MSDEDYIRLAIQLAEKGRPTVSPNPMVGCVIVRDNKIVGQGYHHKSGEPHAEINALNQAGELADKAIMYVTLEPCCHYGQTPPCTEAIIKSGIRRIVASVSDPDPRVKGKGFEQLRRHNIQVEVGLMAKNAKVQNETFIWYVTHKRPFVILKMAASLDGRIATSNGSSRWITNEKSRRRVHSIRNVVDAIVTGIGTIMRDDSRLTVRDIDGQINQPSRIIIDSRLQISCQARVLLSDKDRPAIIVTTYQAESYKIKQLEKKGVKILIAKSGDDNRVDLEDFLDRCGQNQITSLLIEGGQKLATSFLRAKLVNKVQYFIAPKLIGSDGIPSVDRLGVENIGSALFFVQTRWEPIDNDVLFSGYLKP